MASLPAHPDPATMKALCGHLGRDEPAARGACGRRSCRRESCASPQERHGMLSRQSPQNRSSAVNLFVFSIMLSP